MSDWSDDDKPASKPQADNYFAEDSERSEFNRGRGRGGRGRGRGRGGRGGFNQNRNEEDGNSNNWDSGFGQDSNNRDDGSNNGEDNGSGFQSRGRGRGRGGRGSRGGGRGEGRDGRDYQNNENNDNKEGEEKKREVYVPPEPTENEDEIFGKEINAGINFDNFDEIEVKVTGGDAEKYTPMNTFEESGLREFLLNNIKKSGYQKPTPIQKRAIPIILAKRDLMGCAQTGSGKTAAFALPILNVILDENDSLSPGKPQALVMAPTRELAIQIFDEFRKFALKSWVKTVLTYGGAASRYQSENISNGCHVLVATPGRLIDFLDKGIISFEDLKFLVLDEADRMLDMGFRPAIEKVCGHSTIDKSKVTTLMFSATFADSIQHLAGNFLNDYLFLTVGIVGCASTDVEQEFIEVTKFKKREKLCEILDQYLNAKEEDRILVFVETKRTADYLASLLAETKISTTSIHGDRLQREREEALRDFRSGKRKVLVATAVAARGLDIKGVTHVINYDLPKEIDEYVHRIGRTGRVGNRGKATSFFDADIDKNIANDLVRILNQAKQPVPAFLGDCFGCGGFENDTFGGEDIRLPAAVKPGDPQVADEDW